MNVLITGGTGFIGSYVVDQLLKDGDQPVIFDRHVRRPPAGCELILGDVRDPVAVTEACAHVDAVIHLAAVLGTQETITNPRPAAETNILGALNVFEAISQYGLRASYAAVGNHWMDNGYSISKTAAERFAHMFNTDRGTRIGVVRALNAYGPRQSVAVPYGHSKVRKIMPSFVCRALSGHPIEVYGDGSQIMDMIHVRDVAKVFVEAMRSGPTDGLRVYEAGTGRRTTVLDVAQLVQNEVRIQTGIKAEILHLPMRPGEPDHSEVLGDPWTLAPLLGETVGFIPLEEGVIETVCWYADHQGSKWQYLP
jgi:nucleoside-diphosphate-sugar epimerase